MADLGNLLGSLMSSLIRARRMADEQTAVLAEYYKDNPLLEGLSVPRIRIPEITIDLPMLLEDHVDGEFGKMEDPAKIASLAKKELDQILSAHRIRIDPAAYQNFETEVKRRLALSQRTDALIMKEAIVRCVQDAFAEGLTKTRTSITPSDKEIISRGLRAKIGTIALAKETKGSGILANIKTSDVKERASNTSVTRIKVTFKEEGLEWATHASESGGVVRTLQPE